MKSDVALDFAVFQLTPSRNRCELVVVCGEDTERLASGLLKPFLVHLKAAEDQYATGTKEIKLKPPPGYGQGVKPEASAWFTKGTIERFVRFVSTPEVLERVGTVEAELVHLEGAIRDHANESTQVDTAPANTAPSLASAASNILLSLTTDKAPTPTPVRPSRRNSLDGADNPTPDENARRRLLRAMEARKMLLHKEQGMAFARATAAGFDMQKMEHLLVFADCFGANRLGDACIMYTTIFKKSKESGLWDENEWPLSDTTSLRNVPTSPELRPRESDLWSDMHSEAGDFRLEDLRDDVSVKSYSNYYSEDLSLRGYSGTDMLRKRNPLEQPPSLSPSKSRDVGGEYVRGRGGSNHASWDEVSRGSQGQETAGRAYADETSSYPNGTGRWASSLSSQLPGFRYAADSTTEAGNDQSAGNGIGRGQRQRRAWGPPQLLAHQIPLGSQSKSGTLLSDSESSNTSVRGSQHNQNGYHGGSAPTLRIGDSLPSWMIAAGQSDQPWRPGPAELIGHAVSHVVISQPQTHANAANGHAYVSSSTEEHNKSEDANGNLPSPAANSWQEHKRRQTVEVQGKMGSSNAAPSVANGVQLTSAPKVQDSLLTEDKAKQPQSRPVVRRASSPRRRSSSPMRRVQVGRNSMRRSGLIVMKSVNYAPLRAAGTAQVSQELEGSDEETEIASGEQIGSPIKQVEDHAGSGWRGGLSVDTDTDSFSNLAQESVPDQRPSRGSSGWNSPVEDDMEVSENASDHTATGHSARPELLSPKEPKGRFYEQYREKRDAKLREESESKKAERDAKLKSMEEVLERRKAEMAARKGSSAKQNLDAESQVRDEKVRSSKADVVKIKKHKGDDESKRLEEVSNQRRERIAARSSLSPPPAGRSTPSTATTPRATSKQSSTPVPTPLPTLIPTPSLTPKSKPSVVRRLSPPKKVSHGAFRGTVSSPAAPMSTPKLVRTIQRRPQTTGPAKEAENAMSRSVPSLSELRKENTKPALVRNSTYNERPRSTGSKLPGMVRASSAPLESNGSRTTTKGAPSEEKKRGMGIRRSIAVVTDSIKDGPILSPLKVAKVSPAEPTSKSKANKRLSLTSASTTDSKPFLRKGRGIGPGAGPNVRKSKVAAAPEPTKSPEEESEKVPDSESQSVGAGAEKAGTGLASSIDEDERAIARPESSTAQASETLDVGGLGVFPVGSGTPPESTSLALEEDEDEVIRPEEWQEADAGQDGESTVRLPASEAEQCDTRAELSSGNVHSTTLRHFLNEEPQNGSSQNTSRPGSPPCGRSSPIHSIPLSSLSPKGSEVPDLYRAHRGHLSAAAGDTLASPRLSYEVPFASMAESFPSEAIIALGSGSPFASLAPQLHQSLSPDGQTVSGLRKKWGSSQKAGGPPNVKDSPRGLKRLLKFGRKKDKSSAASVTSESPSDIEDDFDMASEHGGRTDELTHIGAKSTGSRIPGKVSGPPAIPEDSVTEGDVGTRLVSIPFVRSSIPAAPAHFKTRDEHVGGSSLLKAPRSFFSLSSFRSKSKQ